eukprot:3410996-Lingulodinium_polyedra.AAC.1
MLGDLLHKSVKLRRWRSRRKFLEKLRRMRAQRRELLPAAEARTSSRTVAWPRPPPPRDEATMRV